MIILFCFGPRSDLVELKICNYQLMMSGRDQNVLRFVHIGITSFSYQIAINEQELSERTKEGTILRHTHMMEGPY